MSFCKKCVLVAVLLTSLLPICGAAQENAFFTLCRQDDGRWFLRAPGGSDFFSLGVDQTSFYVHPCSKRGTVPYHDFCLKKYGSESAWAVHTASRLNQWGFNTVGISDRPGLMYKQGLPFTVFAGIGSGCAFKSALKEPANWRNFPNIFDPGFPAEARKLARERCAPYKDNPLVIGYFLDNELQWRGSNPEHSDLFGDTLNLSAGNPAKIALVGHLRRMHKDDLKDFAAVWGVTLRDWQELADRRALPAAANPERAQAIKLAFHQEIAERYFSVISAAIREADPNHLLLGNRFSGTAPDFVLEAAGRHCDVISINTYPVFDPATTDFSQLKAFFDRIHQKTGRPLFLTEWSFAALDAGLPCRAGGGMRVDSQRERALAAEKIQRFIASLPYFVGSSFLMYVDQSPYGRSPGSSENCNYGLVNENDEPYRELTTMFTRVNAEVLSLHRGETDELAAFKTDSLQFDPVKGRITATLVNHASKEVTLPVEWRIDRNKKSISYTIPPAGTDADCRVIPGEITIRQQVDRKAAENRWLPIQLQISDRARPVNGEMRLTSLLPPPPSPQSGSAKHSYGIMVQTRTSAAPASLW
ncbi:MAG: beta-galactosidase, partial [Victivallaceae bacterium]|nr:beta-galactosidase [Victivallaceae bacterium]